MNISAIDLGFLYTKAIINGKRIIMKSVVGNSKTQRFNDLDFGLKDTDNLQTRLGTNNYFVSDLAIDQSDVILHSLKDDRFSSEATGVLINTAMGLGFGSDAVTTHVVSGLPVSHYSIYREDIKNLFLSKIHNFEVHDSGRLIRGSAKVEKSIFLPQPFGALIDRVMDDKGNVADKELSSKVVAVIDPGFGTSDVYVTDALSPVERLTFSTKTAMNRAYSLISDKLEENFEVILPLYAIEKIVRKGEFRKNGKTYDMSSVINWAFQATAQQLLSEITNKWKNTYEIDSILLAGGGGKALSPYLLKEFPNIELLNNSQWSIVSGYYKWGVKNFA